MLQTTKINIGEIHVEATDTDEILEQKARAKLPVALNEIARVCGENAWRTAKKANRDGFFNIGPMSQFVREAKATYKPTEAEKEKVVHGIIEQLRHRREENASGS